MENDVEAEIHASRQPRQGTQSHNCCGSGPRSSSSGGGVPRTVGARISPGPFFDSTLSADGCCWNNITFTGPPLSLSQMPVGAVQPSAVRHGGGGGHGVEDGPVFTSPDASKHVQELCSLRSAFTPRSPSSV